MSARPETYEDDDLLVSLMSTAVSGAWLVIQSVAWLGLGLARHPVIVALAVATWAYDHAFGQTVSVVTCLALMLSLTVWRFMSAASFHRFVGRPAVTAYRGFVYRARWPHVAARHDLVARSYLRTADGRIEREAASLVRVRSTPAGERVQIKLPVGLTPADFERECGSLAHAFRVRECRVVPDRPGRLWLELHRRDILAGIVPPLPLKERVDLAQVPIGMSEDASLWRLRLLGTHLLVAGATGAGKGSVLWSLLRGLAPAIHDGSVQVWAIDPKGGMELGLGRSLFTRFEDKDPEAMCDLLEGLVAVKDARAKELADEGVRTHAVSPGSPHLLLVVDELATLTAFAERKVTTRIEKALGLLLTQGRACGITVLAAVQDPGKDVVGWRDLFPTRIAMRLDNAVQVDMVLGEGARDRGALADQISELTPGVAYVRVEGTREIRRVRASYLADDAVIYLNSAYAAPVPTWTSPAAGDGGAAA